MAWPHSDRYQETIQNPQHCFSDGELQSGGVEVNALGMPRPRSGTFADVYQISISGSQHKWAVKCFTREVLDQRDRYSKISKCLEATKLPFMVGFDYLNGEILVDGQRYPILKMDWVEGLSLPVFVGKAVDGDLQKLEQLADLWIRLAKRLRQAKIAHGDLQHGNVLLVSQDTGKLGLRLIDYDGMYVPELENNPPGEVGHKNYQHPQRLSEGTFDSKVDRFSHLVIYTALRALAVGGRELWDQFEDDESLLFRQSDFSDPASSKLFFQLWQQKNTNVQALVGHLVLASQGPINEVPRLDELVIGDDVRELTRSEAKSFNEILAGKSGRDWRTLAPPEATVQPKSQTVQAKNATERRFETLLDSMCCIMVADRSISASERQKVRDLMRQVKSPWSDEDVDLRVREFVGRIKSEGLNNVLEQTCNNLNVINSTRQQEALLKCLDQIAAADGFVDNQERQVRARINDALQRLNRESNRPSADRQEANSGTKSTQLQRVKISAAYQERVSSNRSPDEWIEQATHIDAVVDAFQEQLKSATEEKINFTFSLGSHLSLNHKSLFSCWHEDQFYAFELEKEDATRLEIGENNTVFTEGFSRESVIRLVPPRMSLGPPVVNNAEAKSGRERLTGIVGYSTQTAISANVALRLMFSPSEGRKVQLMHYPKLSGLQDEIRFDFPAVNADDAPAASGPLPFFFDLTIVDPDTDEVIVISNTFAVLVNVIDIDGSSDGYQLRS